MKVYGIHTGSIDEGGGIREPLYLDKDKAIIAANEILSEERERVEKLWGKSSEDFDEQLYKDFVWKEKDAGSAVKRWSNCVEEVIIYEYNVI